jgi:hypothetical protein
MPRLLVHVEGVTEETFVNDILRSHLVARGFESVGARLLGNARLRDQRGGTKPWNDVKKDITRHLLSDQDCFATTMVDFYGLPRSGGKAWPGRAAAATLPVPERAGAVESELLADIASAMGSGFNTSRFIPFVVLHEFEGLLFSDCAAFAHAIGRPRLKIGFQAIRDQFDTPEEINDAPDTAPSKRVIGLMPEYQKVLFGNLAILEIGLHKIRQACPHFANWLARLEALAS